MDTPYEVCLERVLGRRAAKGNDKPFDGMKTVHPKIRSCKAVAARAARAGHTVHWIDHRLSGPKQVEALLKRVEALCSNSADQGVQGIYS
jgi:hypothetical protein